MTLEEIKTLESEYLGTKLREILDHELHQKMGLVLSVHLKAKISECALIICWAKLLSNALNSFNKQYSNYVHKKEKFWKMF